MVKLIFILLTYPIMLILVLLLLVIRSIKFICGYETNGFYLVLYGLKYPIRVMKR